MYRRTVAEVMTEPSGMLPPALLNRLSKRSRTCLASLSALGMFNKVLLPSAVFGAAELMTVSCVPV